MASLRKLGPEKLAAVADALSRSDAKLLKLEQFSAFLSKTLDEENALILATSSISLRRVADRFGESVDKVVDALTEGLKEFGWDAAEIAEWQELTPHLKNIVTNRNVELVIKTSDLYYRHRFHLHEAKITTDLRPVLNDARSSIDAVIVKNILSLDYSDGNEDDKSLEVSISDDEMKRFRDEIDRAITKTKLLKAETEKKMGVPVVVYGSDW